MSIERLSTDSLEKLLGNQIREDVTCVIKFYSNGCPYCLALKDTYETISRDFEDVLFFAFNIDDNPFITSIAKINGVPSVMLIKTGNRHKIKILEDPDTPHDELWYHPKDISKFIQKEKR
tara:strand:- start:63 stop:422 length:360 start_codon:yes stop_codon:yes gene_type:complete